MKTFNDFCKKCSREDSSVCRICCMKDYETPTMFVKKIEKTPWYKRVFDKIKYQFLFIIYIVCMFFAFKK